jgi:hypothetical protein
VDGTPDSARAQPDQIFRVATRFRQNWSDIPCPENGPFLLKRRVPARKSATAGARPR